MIHISIHLERIDPLKLYFVLALMVAGMNVYLKFAFFKANPSGMVKIIECDFDDPHQCNAVITLMNHYMADEMGGKLPPYSDEIALKIIEGLKNHPSRLVLLAQYSGEYVGLCNCFINFATFSAKPFINIHDIVVLDKYRGLKIGRKLMEAIDTKARELGCGKITLEVRDDNKRAQKLYKNMGFEEGKPVMHFWSKYFK